MYECVSDKNMLFQFPSIGPAPDRNQNLSSSSLYHWLKLLTHIHTHTGKHSVNTSDLWVETVEALWPRGGHAPPHGAGSRRSREEEEEEEEEEGQQTHSTIRNDYRQQPITSGHL